jgi:Domain of unknown function (DUF5076)
VTKAGPQELSLENGDILTSDSAEIARIWITDGGGSSVWIQPGILENPLHFGYLMADTMRHAAIAYSQRWEIDEQSALQAMCDGFASELREQVETIETIQAAGKLN